MCAPHLFFARGLFSVGPALFAAALCAIDLNLGWNAQIARPYPFEIFFLLAALAIGWACPKPGCFAGSLLLFTAAMWTHPFAFVFVGGAVAAGWLAWFIWRGSGRVATTHGLLWSASLALIANLPFLFIYRLVPDNRIPAEVVGAPASWSEALLRIRWCVGLLTWIHIPLANPLIWLAVVSSLLWWGWRRASLALMAIIGAGGAVVAGQLYAVWHHEFIAPRYMFEASILLWIGSAAAGEILASSKRGKRALAICALALLGAQGIRAWHNDQYYGTIGNDRTAPKRLVVALDYIRLRYPGHQIEILPNDFVLRESLTRLGAPLRTKPEQVPAPTVYLLAGHRAASRRHGNPVKQFVEKRMMAANEPAAEIARLQASCEKAYWTIFRQSDEGMAWKFF